MTFCSCINSKRTRTKENNYAVDEEIIIRYSIWDRVARQKENRNCRALFEKEGPINKNRWRMAGVEGSICKKQGAKARFHNAKYSTRE